MLMPNSIKYLSQQDPKWSGVNIGNSNIKVGKSGCLITCLSMATDFFGNFQSPAEIASNNKFFDDRGNLQWINTDFKNMSFRWREGSQIANGDYKLDIDLIKSYLAHDDNRLADINRAVILGVNNLSHWVLGLYYSEYEDDIRVVDPWTGKDCWAKKTYHTIDGAAMFIKWNKNEHGGKQAWQGAMKPEAPDYF